MNLTNKTTDELKKMAEAVSALAEKNKWHKIDTVFPDTGIYRRELYPAQLNFMRKGAEHRFRCFMGGNRSGKSFTGATELVYHLTGLYPDWWEGRIQKKPKTWWIVAQSGALYRDSIQKLLFGNPGEPVGTGLIPLAEKNNGVGIVSTNYLPGTPNGIGSAIIKHKKGHTVSLIIKTAEMQREQFQAAKVDGILFDEEPPEDIYTECLMRLMGTGKEAGISMLLFTPMKGLSHVVLKYLPNGRLPENGIDTENPEKYICKVTWDDAPHLSEADKKALLAEIPANERDARTRGVPTLGAGRIYPVDENFVTCQPFKIPEYWTRAYGLDFGWHATAAIWVAEDPSTNIRYVYSEYKKGQVIDELHTLAIKARGQWIPGVADPSGGGRKDDGRLRLDFYREKGLSLVPGDNALAVGIARVLNGLESGSYKIFTTCTQLLDELRVYRYDTHNPNKPARNQEDHLLDALRYVDSQFEYVARSFESTLHNRDDYNDFDDDYGRDDVTGY